MKKWKEIEEINKINRRIYEHQKCHRKNAVGFLTITSLILKLLN